MKRAKFESENGYNAEFTQEYGGGQSRNYVEVLDGNRLQGVANSIKIPNRDGVATYGLTRGTREIEMKACTVVYGNKNKPVSQAIAEEKDNICCAFDPRYFGTLYYYAYEGDEGKKIRCRPTALPVMETEYGNAVKFTVGFVSDRAEWSRVKPLTSELGVTKPMWRFPYYIIPKKTVFAVIYNTGGLSNPTKYMIRPKIMIYNSDTAVEVTNVTTGAILKVNHAIAAGERMVIDTAELSVVLETQIGDKWEYAANVINYLDIESVISGFYLAPGRNDLQVQGFGAEKPSMKIEADVPVMGV